MLAGPEPNDGSGLLAGYDSEKADLACSYKVNALMTVLPSQTTVCNELLELGAEGGRVDQEPAASYFSRMPTQPSSCWSRDSWVSKPSWVREISVEPSRS